MKNLSVTMNGSSAIKLGTIYKCNSVKHLTIMNFSLSFKEYGKTDFILDSKEFSNEITLNNNTNKEGNFNIEFTFVPNKSQLNYLIRFKIIENGKSSSIFIMFNSLASNYTNCNTGYIASSTKFENNKLVFNWETAFVPGQWGNGYQKNNWVSIGKAVGNALCKPISLVGTIKRQISNLTHKRMFIGNLINSLWVEITFNEKTVDDYTITDHPVESGEVISDHLVKLPTQYTIKAGFAGNGLFNTIKVIGNAISNIANNRITNPQTLLQSQYNQLLDLQKSKTLFKIVTPKRIYKNMVIKTLSVETDIDTESVLNFTAQCREIQVAYTSATEALIKNSLDKLEINPSNVIGTTTMNQITNDSFRYTLYSIIGGGF